MFDLISSAFCFQLPRRMSCNFTSHHYGNIGIIHFLWALERMHNCIRECSWSSIIPQTWTITKRNSNGIAACFVNSKKAEKRCDARNKKRFEILIWFRWNFASGRKTRTESRKKGEKTKFNKLIGVWPHRSLVEKYLWHVLQRIIEKTRNWFEGKSL